MDPLSITVTCIGLASTITRTSLVVIGFVKDVRAARSDLDTVSRELLSVKTVLELLADDVNESTNHSIPQTLQKQIVGIVTNYTSVVVDIEETLKKHDGGKLNKAAKWIASGKNDVAKLQSSLEAHKSALEIALDMVNLTLAREIKADTQEILNDTSAIKQDTAQILAEIARLQEQLPRGENRRSAGFMLERYLDNLTSYAETVFDPFLDGSDKSRPTSRPTSSGQDTTFNQHGLHSSTSPQHLEITRGPMATLATDEEEEEPKGYTDNEMSEIEEKGRGRRDAEGEEHYRISIAEEKPVEEAGLAAERIDVAGAQLRELELPVQTGAGVKPGFSNELGDQPGAIDIGAMAVSAIELDKPSNIISLSETTTLNSPDLRRNILEANREPIFHHKGAEALEDELSELDEREETVVNDSKEENKPFAAKESLTHSDTPKPEKPGDGACSDSVAIGKPRVNDAANGGECVVPQTECTENEVECSLPDMGWGPERIHTIFSWLNETSIETIAVSVVDNEHSVRVSEAQKYPMLEDVVPFDSSAKSDWTDEIPSSNISTWELDSDAQTEMDNTDSLEAIVSLRRLVAYALRETFSARMLQADYAPGQDHVESMRKYFGAMTLNGDKSLGMDDQGLKIDDVHNQAFLQAITGLSDDYGALREKYHSLLEASEFLGEGERELRNHIDSNRKRLIAQHHISDALDRGLRSLRASSKAERIKSMQDEQMIKRIGVLVAGTKEHISREVQKSLRFERSLEFEYSELLLIKRKMLQDMQEVSRELGVIREAQQKLQATYWGKDVARQTEPQNDKQTAIKPQKIDIRLARAHKASILIERSRALEFYEQMVGAEVEQSLAHVTGENFKGRQKVAPSKTHGGRPREKINRRSIVARFGRGSKIVEWDPSDSFDIPNFCKKYDLPTDII
ncbi:hypothetical protein V8E51_017783 [Hyaloscypha variabilis]